MWSVRPVLKPSGSGSLQPPVQCPTQAWLLGSIRRSQVADPTGQLRGCRDNSRTPPTNGSRIDQVQLATTGLLAIPPWSLHSNSTFFSRATQTGPLCNSLEKKKKETNTTTDDAIHSRLLSSFQASSASRRLRATTHRVNCSSTPPSLPHRAHRRPDSPSGLTATSTDHVRRRRGAADQRRPALIRRDGLAIPPKHPAGPIRLAITTIHHPIPADRRRRDTRSEPARAI